MSGTRKAPPGTPEIVWAGFCGVFRLLVSLNVALSLSFGGLGIGTENGHFIARSGMVHQDLNAGIGLFWWVVQGQLLIAIPVGIILGIVVYARNGTVSISALLNEVKGEETKVGAFYSFSVVVSYLALAYGLVRLAVRLFTT